MRNEPITAEEFTFITLLNLFRVVIMHLDNKRKTPNVSFKRMKKREHNDFHNIIADDPENDFYESFRMSLHMFHTLLSKFRPSLERDQLQGARSRRGIISPEIRLAITLR